MTDEFAQYAVHFLNQYVKIPKNISDKINSLYTDKYESVRHCLGLIVVNLLEFGEIAYSRKKNWYSANHTKHYTYANMLNALEIALADGYAERLKPGYHGRYASTLKAGPRLGEFSLSETTELDLESLPLLMIDKRPIFELDDLNFVKARSANASLESTKLISRLDRVYDEAVRLNKAYWNNIIIATSYIDSNIYLV